MKAKYLILMLISGLILYSCESDEAKFARMKLEEENATKSMEIVSPSAFLNLNNKALLNTETKKVKDNFFAADEYGFSHFSYDGEISNTAQYTSYRDILICFNFKDKEGNKLDEKCYKIKEVVNIGENQKFHLDIEGTKNRTDIASFEASVSDAEALTK